MNEIWYLLKCPKDHETEYTEKYLNSARSSEWTEVVCFRYQRLMRYGGRWHLEKKLLLPGYIFLSRSDMTKTEELNRQTGRGMDGNVPISLSLIPCEIPYARMLCQDGNLVPMSRGVIRNGKPAVLSGPLKGRENLIRKIDRHKRTARIEIPLGGEQKQITVGLEIYEKEQD
jgi:transcriptional antiterminator NusG